MARRFRWVLWVTAAVVILLIPFSDQLFAQDSQASGINPRPGGYLSWIKLLSIAFVFLLWVRMADWINRDAMKIGDKTKMLPELDRKSVV